MKLEEMASSEDWVSPTKSTWQPTYDFIFDFTKSINIGWMEDRIAWNAKALD